MRTALRERIEIRSEDSPGYPLWQAEKLRGFCMDEVAARNPGGLTIAFGFRRVSAVCAQECAPRTCP
ncbi:hypothetical protein MRX96_010772 [Rhipicephalus microplus]